MTAPTVYLGDLEEHEGAIAIMRICGLIFDASGRKPRTITPDDVEHFYVPFQVKHGKPGKTKIQREREKKSA